MTDLMRAYSSTSERSSSYHGEQPMVQTDTHHLIGRVDHDSDTRVRRIVAMVSGQHLVAKIPITPSSRVAVEHAASLETRR